MKYLKNHLLLLFFLSLTGVVAMLNATNPEMVGPGGVALFFGLVYMVSFFGVALISNFFLQKRQFSYRDGQLFLTVGFIAVIPPVALALQSLNQLVIRDVVLLVFLSGIAIFYSIKRG